MFWPQALCAERITAGAKVQVTFDDTTKAATAVTTVQ